MAVLAIISGVATYAALSRKSAPFEIGTDNLRFLMLFNVVVMLGLAGLIARRLARLWAARRQGLAGSRLHSRIVGFFSLIAVGPPILMAISSAVFFEFGLQSWFSDKVQSSLNNSLQVAEAYINEHRRVIQADILAMAGDIDRQAPIVEANPRLLQLLVDDQAARRALSEAIVFDGSGVILAQTSLSLSLSPDRMPQNVLQRVQEGELVVISETDDDRVRAVIRLDAFFDAYLYVSRAVDVQVLAHVSATRASIADYQSIEGERSMMQLRFNMIYLIVALLILMAAVWIGLWFANHLVQPIGALVNAADKVADGDLDARVPAMSTVDEIGTLSRAFNRMTSQLAHQQRDLIAANAKMDERRRFTEAVLFGVSAGVVGLDKNGVITLPNRSASQLLGRSHDELEGKAFVDVLPEIKSLLDELMVHGQEMVQGQVNMVRDGAVYTLLARITAEDRSEDESGYVVTFDDITEQLAHQRTAAWADVARRIAHEIKNPLTPIQLSAERLLRKYGKEIQTDPEVFKQCTDTIIRQVGDLKRMVDEFSSFARMPKPVFREEDITDLTRQALFLQEVSRPNIQFELHAPAGSARVMCDGRLIAQALTNLIKNASESISAMETSGDDAQGKIDVYITPTEGHLEVSVVDNGVGFPEELASNIMEPYVTTREKGTGLGLAIVRKIMEDHGGTLQMENRRNQSGARAILQFSLANLGRLTESKASKSTALT